MGIAAVERRHDQDLQYGLDLLRRHDVQISPQHATQRAEESRARDDDPPAKKDVGVAIPGVDAYSREILEQRSPDLSPGHEIRVRRRLTLGVGIVVGADGLAEAGVPAATGDAVPEIADRQLDEPAQGMPMVEHDDGP